LSPKDLPPPPEAQTLARIPPLRVWLYLWLGAQGSCHREPGSVSRRCVLWDARDVPRAPLPAMGVTHHRVVPAPPQRALPLFHRSYGLMRPTKLLARLSDALCRPSLQGVASPCWRMVVPDVISACLSLDAWTPTPAASWVLLPIASPPPSAFPQSLWVGCPQQSAQRLPSGGDFGAAVIHSCSGLEVCCHPGRSHRRVETRGSCGVYVRAEHRALPSGASDILAVRTGN
jgi:hypothetical protein